MYERTATGLSPDMVRSGGLSDPVADGGVRTVARCCSCGLHAQPPCISSHSVFTISGPRPLPWQNMAYKLRPETAESLFVLHHTTGNPIYREWGWQIYQAIEK